MKSNLPTKVISIIVNLLLLIVLPLVVLFGPVQSVSADTIYNQCRTLDKSRCPTDQFDHNHCLDLVSQYYAEIGQQVIQDPETDNWTENNCTVTVSGCFVPIPNHNHSNGSPLGVCVAPVDEEPAEVVNCDNVRSTSYRDQCPSSTYTLCFDTNNHPLPRSVADVDCRINPPGPDELFFFYNQESFDQQAGLATADCSVGQPLSEEYPDICGDDRPISCIAAGRYRCCATQDDCDDIGGTKQECMAIPEVSANLNDCENNTSRPSLCTTQNTDGSKNYFCCSSDDACEEEKDGTPTEPLVQKEEDPEKGSDYNYCKQVPSDQRDECQACMGAWSSSEKKYANEGKKIYTAVGCVRVEGEELAADLIKLLLGIGGGVALLSMLAAAFKFTISKGDSGKIKEAKELMTAAVSGLLFLIFSVIILQFIGVEILQIPGLG